MRLVWVVIILVFFSVIGIEESFASMQDSVPQFDVRTFYDHNGTNWNYATNTRNGITITLETNKMGWYSEFEAIKIKANMTNVGPSPVPFSYNNSCYDIPNIQLLRSDETWFPQHNSFNEMEQVLCVEKKGEIMILPGDSYSKDIMWKQQGPLGNYVLRATFNDGIVELPIKIIKYGVLEPSIQNIKVLDLTPKKQFEIGISPELTVCKENYKLIFKPSDVPVCVKPNSFTKLIERGWSKDTTQPPHTIWIESLYPQCGGPIWVQDWTKTHDKSWKYSNYGEIETGEVKIILDYFKKFDISIIDVKRSSENAQSCEACYCIAGTYHLLVSIEDFQKWTNLN